jgi:glucosamine-phosphate N-acetyltransferase
MSEVIIREIKEDDLWNGFLKSLDSLKQASNIEKSKAKEIFEEN